MGEWWNKTQILPGTEHGMSRVPSPLSPAPVKVSSQRAGPRSLSRPLSHAGRKHWRGEESKGTGCTQSNSPRHVAPRLRPPLRPHLPEKWRGRGGEHKYSSWGGHSGSCSCSLEGGSGNLKSPALKPPAVWPGASHEHLTASVYPSKPDLKLSTV